MVPLDRRWACVNQRCATWMLYREARKAKSLTVVYHPGRAGGRPKRYLLKQVRYPGIDRRLSRGTHPGSACSALWGGQHPSLQNPTPADARFQFPCRKKWRPHASQPVLRDPGASRDGPICSQMGAALERQGLSSGGRGPRRRVGENLGSSVQCTHSKIPGRQQRRGGI